MKKVLYAIFMLCLTFAIIYLIYYFVSGSNKNESVLGKYNYYDDLLNLGYNDNQIKKIEEKFTTSEVKDYLLNKKYDHLLEFKESKLFDISKLDRYEEYLNKNDYSYEEVITYVHIGLDYDFYTHIKEVQNYNDKLVLVNKYNKLPDKYEIKDLYTLDNTISINSQQVKEEIVDDLKLMIKDASKKDIKLFVVSGYRTNELQSKLFSNSEEKNGIEHALLYSAKAGHSEHQTGYAVDLNSTNDDFKDTLEYKWLSENAYKYGFIERYPQGKEYITGYAYEPWHYRYVGIEVATIVHSKNITFEEYSVLY